MVIFEATFRHNRKKVYFYDPETAWYLALQGVSVTVNVDIR